MSQPRIKSNLFNLDTNIDGIYVDAIGNEIKIPNLIQVVAATDGSQSYPPLSGSNLTDLDINELPSDADEVRGNRGHGILYDKYGKQYAVKGDLVFRDSNMQSPLKTIVNKVKSISELKTLDVYLSDSSLSSITHSSRGVDLDSLINKAISNTSPFGLGNVVQASRNSKNNNISVSTFTSQITPNNTVWVVAHANVKGCGSIRLRDVTADKVLTVSYGCSENKQDIIPVYISYVGTLPEVSTTITSDSCCSFDTSIYNSFYKRFFIKKVGQISNIHEIAVEMVPEGTDENGNDIINLFSHATINILVMDELKEGMALTGSVIVDNTNEVEVKFNTEMQKVDYSISIQTSNAIQNWYTNKSTSGFTIKFEREYVGDVFWTAFGGNT